MSKLLVIGDPHAKPENLESIKALTEIAESSEFQGIIWLGDMLDTKEVVRSKCLNLWYTYFKNSKKDHYILVGNHDYHNLECKDHALVPLADLEQVLIVDKPMYLDGFDIVAMPYYHDNELFKKDLNKMLLKNKKATVFAHQGITGFDYGNGYIAEDELDFSDLNKKKNLFILGHFHKHQSQGNVVYLGTPFSQSFGESNQDKFLGVYDIDSKSLELIETDFPKHVTIELDCDNIDKSGVPSYKKQDHVRMILSGSQDNINKMRIQLDEEALDNVKVIEKVVQENGLSDSIINEDDSNYVKFNKWAKDIAKLDDKTIKLGMAFLEASE